MAPKRPRQIGTEAERAATQWLQGHGWPHAERRALRGTQDAGDITGTPALAWSVKAGKQARQPSDLLVADWLAELEQQRQRAGAEWGVLITRRFGIGDPGRWWAWMPAAAVIQLGARPGAARVPALAHAMPLRMHLQDAAALLRHAGYGEAQ